MKHIAIADLNDKTVTAFNINNDLIDDTFIYCGNEWTINWEDESVVQSNVGPWLQIALLFMDTRNSPYLHIRELEVGLDTAYKLINYIQSVWNRMSNPSNVFEHCFVVVEYPKSKVGTVQDLFMECAKKYIKQPWDKYLKIAIKVDMDTLLKKLMQDKVIKEEPFTIDVSMDLNGHMSYNIKPQLTVLRYP